MTPHVADASESESVKAPQYGAVGDGVTDDTQAIQDAIDVAEAAGGGIVYVPAGDYAVTNLTIGGTVRLVGDGVSAASLTNSPTRLIFAGGAGDALAITTTNHAALERIAVEGSNEYDNGVVITDSFHPTLREVLVQGFTKAGAYGVRIVCTSARSTLHGFYADVAVFDCTNGVELADTTGGGKVVNNHVFVGCRVDQSSGGTGTGIGLRVGELANEVVWQGGNVSRWATGILVDDNNRGPYVYGANIESNTLGLDVNDKNADVVCVASFHLNTTRFDIESPASGPNVTSYIHDVRLGQHVFGGGIQDEATIDDFNFHGKVNIGLAHNPSGSAAGVATLAVRGVDGEALPVFYLRADNSSTKILEARASNATLGFELDANGRPLADVMSELTAGAGVTVDGVLLKDGGIAGAALPAPDALTTRGGVFAAAAVTDASVAHALNAVFDDTEVESALNALGAKINAVIDALQSAGVMQ